jgi:hypothetical protein
MAKRKPVNRKMSPPPVPLEEREGEVVGFPFFNLEAPEGFYKIDSFKSYVTDAQRDYRSPIAPTHQDIRMFVEHAAGFASLSASRELHIVNAHKFASAAIADLENIRRVARRLLKMESEKFEEIFNSGTKLTEATAKIRQRESLLRQTAQLAAFAENRPYVAPPPTGQVITAGTTHTALKAVEANIEALLRDRKICKKPLVPTMSDPLARAFIWPNSGKIEPRRLRRPEIKLLSFVSLPPLGRT